MTGGGREGSDIHAIYPKVFQLFIFVFVCFAAELAENAASISAGPVPPGGRPTGKPTTRSPGQRSTKPIGLGYLYIIYVYVNHGENDKYRSMVRARGDR